MLKGLRNYLKATYEAGLEKRLSSPAYFVYFS